MRISHKLWEMGTFMKELYQLERLSEGAPSARVPAGLPTLSP